MKPKIIRPLFFPILLSVILFSSCRTEIGDEVKVPDFKTLESLFNDPPAEYTSAPFFVWNADINRDDIDRFMTDFKEAGSSQVFIHPRPGLITEYISDKWFELFRYTVDKGKELGMRVWIYDENSYPSGFGGGHVPAAMPESFNQGQGLRLTKAEVLPDTAARYYLVLREDGDAFTDITASLNAEKGKTGKYWLFSKTFNGKSDWYGGFTYVDLLYPGVTEKFIELTMAGYEKAGLQEFGKAIPGTFTDEPQINSPGGIRFTPDIFDRFFEEWNYDLRTNLPSLYEETGDWKRVRHNYTQTLLQLFINRWAKPWFEYCEEKGLEFTGHYWEHEWPNMRPGGDNMALYAWHHVPGIDMLFNQWNDSTPRAQFGNVRSVKELASAANQTGRLRKLSETYGGSGWDLTFTEMKRNGDWEYALGVNLMNQHLTYFTMAGARKYDYPPTFDYHEPWWNNYKYINDHYSRLSLALSSGRQVNDILVLEPTTTCWLYDSYARRSSKTTEIGQAFQTFITRLEKSQVEYDLGSENILGEIGSVRNGRLVVGDASYSRVVIPPFTENLDHSTFKLLEKFVAGGGTLISFSTPVLVDGAESQSLNDFLEKYADRIISEKELSGEIITKYFGSNGLEIKQNPGGVLYHHTRTLADGKLIFLVNSSLTENLSGRVSFTGKGAIEMNTISGSVSGYPCVISGEKAIAEFGLPPAGSLLLFLPDGDIPGYPARNEEGISEPVSTASRMAITRNEPNALTIDFCDITLEGQTLKDLHVVDAEDRIFRHYGFRNGNPWNHSVQYKTNIVDRDTFGVNTGFTASYQFTVKGKFDYSSMQAVIERPFLWKVELNGNEISPVPGKWWLDRAFSVFSIGDLVREGTNVITLTVQPMKIHAETEPVYIIGDFSVEPAPKGWEIKAPAVKLTAGSWKSQGLPFYSWDITYSKEYGIVQTSGKYEVALGDWKGTVAEVHVNGKKAGILAFPPYRTDVTEYISQGSNSIEIKVIGSLKNLLGPHHNNPPAGLASPGNWRNIKSYPSGKDYVMFDYGLMEEFTLLHEKN